MFLVSLKNLENNVDRTRKYCVDPKDVRSDLKGVSNHKELNNVYLY
jgi:hypothetical protein